MHAKKDPVRAEDATQLESKLLPGQHVDVEVDGVVELGDDGQNAAPLQSPPKEPLGRSAIGVDGHPGDDREDVAGKKGEAIHKAYGQQHSRGLRSA